nr:rhomboid-related protein 1-like [Lepeophtheirus salmonis]
MILLLLVGVPLEMYHSTWRTLFVYLIGSVSGSVLVSVIDKKRPLAGASGGVSSLAAAHVADIALNWTEDTIIFRHRLRTNRPARVIKSECVRIGRLCIIGFIISLDVYNCLRQRYGSSRTGDISYISHVGGAIFGFLVGYLVLHHHFFRKNNKLIRCLVLIGNLSVWAFMILEHIFNDTEFPPLDPCDLSTFRKECSDKCYKYIPQFNNQCNITFC